MYRRRNHAYGLLKGELDAAQKARRDVCSIHSAEACCIGFVQRQQGSFQRLTAEHRFDIGVPRRGAAKLVHEGIEGLVKPSSDVFGRTGGSMRGCNVHGYEIYAHVMTYVKGRMAHRE